MILPQLLIVDDEKNTREALKKLLSAEYDIFLAASVEEALQYIDGQQFRVIITDLRLGGNTSGLTIIQHTTKRNIPCVMMTAFGDVDTAVTAMKNGAFDFVTKPLNFQKLKITLKQAVDYKTSALSPFPNPYDHLLSSNAHVLNFGGIASENSPFKRILEYAVKVANNRANVLLFGETGTGKEILAQTIHRASPRKNQPLIAIHCTALSSTLLESELFGHEKGAFTGATATHIGYFEAANYGTIFLDEIGEIDALTQVKLLRFLETKTFERVGGTRPIHIDVRIISATNKNLAQMVREGTFREDLYYRLNVIELKLPPLRERKEDIPLLFQHYIEYFCRENALEIIPVISAKTMEKMIHYSWPGNIRELKNTCESIIALLPRGQKEITANDLGEKFSSIA
ncbi:MAG: sigma-54 dependent transcriptional regulator [Puniceicoccales bacterium]|jgi:DNA-binding NtrC family response regulator|nr:sigma-54 dependent transcriptional regulator [Puniceicoccales bacterium]